MAVRNPLVVETNRKYITIKWEGMLLNDEGGPVDFSEFGMKTVQIMGTPGAGGKMFIEGSMDGIVYEELTQEGSPSAIEGIGIHVLRENPKFIKPVTDGGDGTTNWTVILGMSNLVS